MKVVDVVKIIKGEVVTPYKNRTIKGIKVDTRTLHSGDVFIALKGGKVDGHDYIKEAIHKRAACIIVEKEVNIKTSIPIIGVENTYDSLFFLASYYREKYNPLVIGITGSSGKTTTREMIYKILSTKYNVLKSEKNYNNHIGVPLTLFKMDNTYDIALIEMGMNHAHEIEDLSKLVEPSLGIITGIGTSHIGHLKSKKNIFKSKMEITEGLNEGILLVNGDDLYLRKLKSTDQYDVIKCGYHSTYHLVPYHVKEELESLTFSLYYQGKEYAVRVNVTGRHFLVDCMLAIETGLLFDIEMESIIKSLSMYQAVNRRMNVIYKEHFTLIDDCYNASPESFKGVLNFLQNRQEEKILIAGDMLELGKYSRKIHKKIGKEIRKIKQIKVLTIGKQMKDIKGNNIIHFESKEEMILYLDTMNFMNKLIVIKGSRGMHLEKIKEYIERRS